MSNGAQYKPGDFSLGQVHEFLGAFGRQGGTPALLQRGIEDEDAMSNLVLMLKPIKKPAAYKVMITPFTMVVDYDRSLDAMIEDGKYDWHDPNINSRNFPTSRAAQKKPTNFVLVHFSRDMNLDEILWEFITRELRFADMAEFLAFGAKYPEKQSQYPIMSLGLISNGWRPNLDHSGSRRNLCLTSHRYARAYDAENRYAAVRK